jgi:2-amino-4-hydroxy-6-hydroxymethyldihydropteridine diphosphokinase
MTGKTYIGLGSNVGDRRATVRRALDLLEQRGGVRVTAVSQLIETAPTGGPPQQNNYINGVAEIETALAPTELLHALAEIEAFCGRNRATEERWGPRTCDLDILLMGDLVMRTPELVIPHPRMHVRLFVLRPLAELAPQAVHPVLGKTIAELLAAAEGSAT